MIHHVKEANAPLPSNWKPGMPLPSVYKFKNIEKLIPIGEPVVGEGKKQIGFNTFWYHKPKLKIKNNNGKN